MSSKIIIFKNDAVGDLVHSLHAINNIIINNKDKSIIIYLSERSKNFSFLIDNKNITFKIVSYNLTLAQKIQIFYFILTNNISKTYILTPKSFYFLLAPIFRKTKFYGLCINGPNNYKRPNNYFRKYLYKYVINDRAAVFKRNSSEHIQNKLSNYNDKLNQEFKSNINIKISDILKKYLPKDYFYFHIRKKRLDELGWGISELNLIFEEFLKYSSNVVITKDIEVDKYSKILKENFNSFDYKNFSFINKEKKIIFFDNIEGRDVYTIIKLSKKIIAFHGMMTSLGSINKKKTLDLYHCNIKNWNDYRNYRNSFYEFKPNYDGYDFIIPSKDIKKSLRKMKFFLRN